MGRPRSRSRSLFGHMRRLALVLSHANETALITLHPPEGGLSPPYSTFLDRPINGNLPPNRFYLFASYGLQAFITRHL